MKGLSSLYGTVGLVFLMVAMTATLNHTREPAPSPQGVAGGRAAPTDGNQVGPAITSTVPVSEGPFTVNPDSGEEARCLGTVAMCPGESAYAGPQTENATQREQIDDLVRRSETLERERAAAHHAEAGLPAGSWLGLESLLAGLVLVIALGLVLIVLRKDGMSLGEEAR